MDLGEYYPCLNVKNLTRSIEFYLKLDFRIIEDHRSENWAVLQHNNMALCLYQGHIDENLINFRGGARARAHGSWPFIYVDTFCNQLREGRITPERNNTRYLGGG
jgi:hypothetical protein